jgi:hypothetical protein
VEYFFQIEQRSWNYRAQIESQGDRLAHQTKLVATQSMEGEEIRGRDSEEPMSLIPIC